MGDRFGYLGQALLGVLKDDVDAGCLGVARDQVSAKERFRERDGFTPIQLALRHRRTVPY